MRDHVVLCFLATVSTTVGLFVVGLGTNQWLQLLVPVCVAIVCTRLLAPVYFGWHEPGDAPARRRQR